MRQSSKWKPLFLSRTQVHGRPPEPGRRFSTNRWLVRSFTRTRRDFMTMDRLETKGEHGLLRGSGSAGRDGGAMQVLFIEHICTPLSVTFHRRRISIRNDSKSGAFRGRGDLTSPHLVFLGSEASTKRASRAVNQSRCAPVFGLEITLCHPFRAEQPARPLDNTDQKLVLRWPRATL